MDNKVYFPTQTPKTWYNIYGAYLIRTTYDPNVRKYRVQKQEWNVIPTPKLFQNTVWYK